MGVTIRINALLLGDALTCWDLAKNLPQNLLILETNLKAISERDFANQKIEDKPSKN